MENVLKPMTSGLISLRNPWALVPQEHHERCILPPIPLLRVVEDDPHGVTLTRTHLADPMAHIDSIGAASALHWAGVNRESHSITLLEWHDFRARLQARALLGEHKFAAHEVLTRGGEQNGHLNWEHMLSVEILMQAIVIA